MSYEIVSDGVFPDYTVWTCDSCGRSMIVPPGGDVAFCPCEFEEEC